MVKITNNANRTEWSPIGSVIIQVKKKPGEFNLFNPKSMITDQTGRHEVMLSINHNQDKICDKRNSKTFFASSVLLVLKSGELIANLNKFENFVMVMTNSIILYNIFYLLESFPNLTFHTGSIAVDFVSG